MDKKIEEIIAGGRKKSLYLTNTKLAAEMYRDAKANGTNPMVIDELYLLIVGSAKDEWGLNTTIDDFSVEGKFVVKNGKKEDTI